MRDRGSRTGTPSTSSQRRLRASSSSSRSPWTGDHERPRCAPGTPPRASLGRTSEGITPPILRSPSPGCRNRSGVYVVAVHPLRARHDEVLAGRDVVAHQELEDRLGLHHRPLVRCRDAPQGPVSRVHRGLGELLGVHLPEALVALDGVLVAPALLLKPVSYTHL